MRGFGRVSPTRPSLLPAAALISLGLHAALLAGVLVRLPRKPARDDAPPMGAIELVMVETRGAHTPAVPVPSPSQPAIPPPPPSDAAQIPVPSPAPPPAPTAQPGPVINLGAGEDETNAMVSGPGVIPASLDAKARNREPVYPPEAVRLAEQGAVVLMVHVSRQGLADGVDVLETSGFAVLDRAARDAVVRWHFLPAVSDGRPVPFDMTLRVVFRLD